MALSIVAVWEVRTTGSDTLNSGGFVAGAAGTDYSQQAAAQYSGTDLVVDATTNTIVTSVSHSFISTDVGNILRVKSGASWTVGFYQIVSVATGAATLDRSPAVINTTGGSYAVGGAFATPGQAGAASVGSNTTWIKNGTYTATNSTPNASGGYFNIPVGLPGNPTLVIGYNAVRGDLDAVTNYANFPTIKNAAAGDSTCIRLVFNYAHVKNIIADGSSVGIYGFYETGQYTQTINCKAINSTNGFYNNGGQTVYFRCLATANGSGFSSGATLALFEDCIATANTTCGFTITSYSVFIHCIAYANAGVTVDGVVSSSGVISIFINSVFVANGRDGIRQSVAISNLVVHNCIFGGNSGFSLNSAVTNLADGMLDYNAFFASTSGDRNNLPAGPHDVALSGNPFTNSASGDFSLNNTAGQGAACRAAGFPGIMPLALTKGFADIGAAQSQSPGLFSANLEGS